MILKPIDEERLIKYLEQYARNHHTEATLEELLAYLYRRGLRMSAETLKRKLEKLAEKGFVSISHREHFLLIERNGKKWFLPVKRRVYLIKITRMRR